MGRRKEGDFIIHSSSNSFFRRIKKLKKSCFPWYFFLTILVGISVALLNFYLMNEKRHQKLQLQFDRETEKFSHFVESSFQKYFGALNFFFPLFDDLKNEGQFSHKSFETWHKRIQKIYPRIAFLKYMPLVKRKEIPGFQKKAIEKAIEKDLELSTYTAKLSETSNISYKRFLFFIKPIYKKHYPLNTEEERWEALLGFVTAAMDLKDMIDQFFHVNDINKEKSQSIYEVHLYRLDDDQDEGKKELIYARCRDAVEFENKLGRSEAFVKGAQSILLEGEKKEERRCPYYHSTFQHSHVYDFIGQKWELSFRSVDKKIFLAYWEGYVISFLVFLFAGFLIHLFTNQVRREEAKTEDSQKFFFAISNIVIEALITINEKGRIQFVNSSVSKIFGYTSEELVGKNVKILMPSKVAEAHDEYLKRYKETGNKRVIGKKRKELEGLRKNGEVFPLSLGVNEVVVDGKKIFVGTIEDLTEDKLAEQKLHSTIKRLSQANSDLEYFNYIASHDLQEPLRVISNFTHLLHEKIHKQDFSDKKIFSYTDFIVSAAERMRGLLKDLLEYSRMTKSVIRVKKVNLEVILSDVLSNLQNVIKDSDAQIIYKDLPVIQSHPSMLTCLIQNLIDNAIKYCSLGTQPHVIFKVEEREKDWLFSVQDNGIGINEKYLEQVFLPFKRLHSNEEYIGTGIGLASCKKIVESCNGSIWVESEEGKGSVFYFVLPKKEPFQASKERNAKNLSDGDGNMESLNQEKMRKLG